MGHDDRCCSSGHAEGLVPPLLLSPVPAAAWRTPGGLRAGSETLLQLFPSWDTSWHGLFEAFWIFLLPDTILLNVDKNAFPS